MKCLLSLVGLLFLDDKRMHIKFCTQYQLCSKEYILLTNKTLAGDKSDMPFRYFISDVGNGVRTCQLVKFLCKSDWKFFNSKMVVLLGKSWCFWFLQWGGGHTLPQVSLASFSHSLTIIRVYFVQFCVLNWQIIQIPKWRNIYIVTDAMGVLNR